MYKIIKKCGICENTNLTAVFELKMFPLTGIFVKKTNNILSNYYDQKINVCKKCGHIQLSKFISRKKLYNNFYANRTSASHLSDQSIKFFKDFLFKCCKKKKLDNILEIGCNDLKLLKSLKKNSNTIFGIDPIWINKKNPSKKNFKIIGDYAETVNFKKKIKVKIKLFLNTHNLEHIENPYKLLKKVVNFASDDALFFIEVPDADLMIKNYRFDQIFHQHYHYFSFNSLKNLIKRLKCKVIKKSINYNFWGGSLIVSFKKDNNFQKNNLKNNFRSTYRDIHTRYKFFKKHYKKLYKKIESRKNLIGYGAGQMVPSLAYHIGSDLSFLQYIVDDNKKRSGFRYPGLYPKIKICSKNNLQNKEILITALDGVKSISKKLAASKIKFIDPLPKKN